MNKCNKNADQNLLILKFWLKKLLLVFNFVCFEQLLQMQYKRDIILIREYLSILDCSPCPLC